MIEPKPDASVTSDRGATDDIVEIDRHPLGLVIYRFRYRAEFADRYGSGPHIGVMADEVAERYPDAVSRRADGYLMVDYGRLFGPAPKTAMKTGTQRGFADRLTWSTDLASPGARPFLMVANLQQFVYRSSESVK